MSGRCGFRKQSVAVDDQGRGAGITASGDRCGWGNVAKPRPAHSTLEGWPCSPPGRPPQPRRRCYSGDFGQRRLEGKPGPPPGGSAAASCSSPLFGPRSGAGHTGASPTLPFQQAGGGRLFTGCGMIDGIDGTVCRMARAGLRMSQGRLCGSRSRFHLVNMPRPPDRDCIRSPRRREGKQ